MIAALHLVVYVYVYIRIITDRLAGSWTRNSLALSRKLEEPRAKLSRNNSIEQTCNYLHTSDFFTAGLYRRHNPRGGIENLLCFKLKFRQSMSNVFFGASEHVHSYSQLVSCARIQYAKDRTMAQGKEEPFSLLHLTSLTFSRHIYETVLSLFFDTSLSSSSFPCQR